MAPAGGGGGSLSSSGPAPYCRGEGARRLHRPAAHPCSLAAMRPMATRLLYATFPSLESARSVGRAVVEARLAACANILPAMRSIYRWEGRMEEADEVVLLLKTTAEAAEAAVAAVRARHPYELPAILVLTVDGGDAAFLQWVADEVAPRG